MDRGEKGDGLRGAKAEGSAGGGGRADGSDVELGEDRGQDARREHDIEGRWVMTRMSRVRLRRVSDRCIGFGHGRGLRGNCGLSTHLREKKGQEKVRTADFS